MDLEQNFLPSIITLYEKPDLKNRPGKLIAINDYEINMPIKRIFYLFDFDKDISINRRGCHAHKNTRQILIMLRGSVDITTKHLMTKKEFTFTLTTPNMALDLPPNNYIHLLNYTENAIMIALCNEVFENDIYIT